MTNNGPLSPDRLFEIIMGTIVRLLDEIEVREDPTLQEDLEHLRILVDELRRQANCRATVRDET